MDPNDIPNNNQVAYLFNNVRTWSSSVLSRVKEAFKPFEQFSLLGTAEGFVPEDENIPNMKIELDSLKAINKITDKMDLLQINEVTPDKTHLTPPQTNKDISDKIDLPILQINQEIPDKIGLTPPQVNAETPDNIGVYLAANTLFGELLNGKAADPLKIKRLLDKGANPNEKYKYHKSKTPLNLAILKCDIEIVKLLIEYGAKVNPEDVKEVTPLQVAANKGKLEVIKFLLQNGADINAKGLDGITATQLAWQYGQPWCLEYYDYLVSKGGEITGEGVADSTYNLREAAKKYPKMEKIHLNEAEQLMNLFRKQQSKKGQHIYIKEVQDFINHVTVPVLCLLPHSEKRILDLTQKLLEDLPKGCKAHITLTAQETAKFCNKGTPPNKMVEIKVVDSNYILKNPTKIKNEETCPPTQVPDIIRCNLQLKEPQHTR